LNNEVSQGKAAMCVGCVDL